MFFGSDVVRIILLHFRQLVLSVVTEELQPVRRVPGRRAGHGGGVVVASLSPSYNVEQQI